MCHPFYIHAAHIKPKSDTVGAEIYCRTQTVNFKNTLTLLYVQWAIKLY